jgi:hypothetical protein
MKQKTLLCLFFLAQLVVALAQPQNIYYSPPNENLFPSILMKDKQGNFIISGEMDYFTNGIPFEGGYWRGGFYAKLNRQGGLLGNIPETYNGVYGLHPLANNTYLSLGTDRTEGKCNGIAYSYSPFVGNQVFLDPSGKIKKINSTLWSSFKSIIDDSMKHKLVDIEAINDSCALEFKSSYKGSDNKIRCLFDASMDDIYINGYPYEPLPMIR